MQSNKVPNLLELPQKCLTNIFDYLPQKDRLGTLRQVSRQLHSFITCSPHFWKKLCVSQNLNLLVANKQRLPFECIQELDIRGKTGEKFQAPVPLELIGHFTHLRKLDIKNVNTTEVLKLSCPFLRDLKIKRCSSVRSIEVLVPGIDIEKLILTHCMLDIAKLPLFLSKIKPEALHHLRFGYLASDADIDILSGYPKNPGPALLSFIATIFHQLQTLKITTNLISLWDLVVLSKGCPYLSSLTFKIDPSDYIPTNLILEKAKSYKSSGWMNVQFPNLKVAQIYGLQSSAFEIRDFLCWTPNLEVCMFSWSDNLEDLDREVPISLVTAFDCNPQIQHYYRSRNRFLALSMPLEKVRNSSFARTLRHIEETFLADVEAEECLVTSRVVKPPVEGVVHCDKKTKDWQPCLEIPGIRLAK